MRYLICLTMILFLLLFFVLNPYSPTPLIQKKFYLHGATSTASRDLVIAVKTTKHFHRTRVNQIVDTWFQLSPDDVFFVTDSADSHLNKSVHGHLINSYCPIGHFASALVCKMNRQLRLFVESDAKWSCLVDDDNFVNVPLLKETLLEMDEMTPYYLGKKSTNDPVSIYDGASTTRPFWFGTGGAGICLSHAAVQKMAPRIANNRFPALGSRLHLTDDLALGFFMANVLGIELTEMSNFHSHLEDLQTIPVKQLKNQPILSGGSISSFVVNDNLVALPYLFDPDDDPLKFRSLYCFIFDKDCPPGAKAILEKFENPESLWR